MTKEPTRGPLTLKDRVEGGETRKRTSSLETSSIVNYNIDFYKFY